MSRRVFWADVERVEKDERTGLVLLSIKAASGVLRDKEELRLFPSGRTVRLKRVFSADPAGGRLKIGIRGASRDQIKTGAAIYGAGSGLFGLREGIFAVLPAQGGNGSRGAPPAGRGELVFHPSDDNQCDRHIPCEVTPLGRCLVVRVEGIFPALREGRYSYLPTDAKAKPLSLRFLLPSTDDKELAKRLKSELSGHEALNDRVLSSVALTFFGYDRRAVRPGSDETQFSQAFLDRYWKILEPLVTRLEGVARKDALAAFALPAEVFDELIRKWRKDGRIETRGRQLFSRDEDPTAHLSPAARDLLKRLAGRGLEGMDPSRDLEEFQRRMIVDMEKRGIVVIFDTRFVAAASVFTNPEIVGELPQQSWDERVETLKTRHGMSGRKAAMLAAYWDEMEEEEDADRIPAPLVDRRPSPRRGGGTPEAESGKSARRPQSRVSTEKPGSRPPRTSAGPRSDGKKRDEGRSKRFGPGKHRGPNPKRGKERSDEAN